MIISGKKSKLTETVCNYLENAFTAFDQGKLRSHKINFNKARKEWNATFGPRVDNFNFDGFADNYCSILERE